MFSRNIPVGWFALSLLGKPVKCSTLNGLMASLKDGDSGFVGFFTENDWLPIPKSVRLNIADFAAVVMELPVCRMPYPLSGPSKLALLCLGFCVA